MAMKNPWGKKNPFMSMWLSSANTVLGASRGHTMAAAKREMNKAAATTATVGVKQVMDFWASAFKPPTVARKKRKKR